MNKSIFLNELENKQVKYPGHMRVKLIDPLPQNIDLHKVFRRLSDIVPARIREKLNLIIFQQTTVHKLKNINAYYDTKTNNVYIAPKYQKSNEDLFDDIVHELAHCIEHKMKQYIPIESLEREFLGKRETLYYLIKNYGFNVPDIEIYRDLKYNKSFDDYIYSVDHNTMHQLANKAGIVSVYSTLSVSEYFAVGFEKFYLSYLYPKEYLYIQKYCPVLFFTINQLDQRSN